MSHFGIWVVVTTCRPLGSGPSGPYWDRDSVILSKGCMNFPCNGRAYIYIYIYAEREILKL